MNAVILTCYDTTPKQLELTKKALESALAQDIPVDVFVYDNGSTQDVQSLVTRYPDVACRRSEENDSPVKVANERLGVLFHTYGRDYVLTIPSDVVIPPNLYREFLRWPRGVVTASMTEGTYTPCVESKAISECTPLCVVMWRRWVYDAVVAKDGFFFDPRYEFYCSDCDLALRMSACGIRGVQLDLTYTHFGSASHRLATPEVGDKIRAQADVDRAAFADKWGFRVFEQQYVDYANDINFRG